MELLILALSIVWLAHLAWESYRVRQARATIVHVIHVNGTRGKSTVCRLIEAGLRSGGMRVFCKTTGTDPMTIDVEGREELLLRRGRANIKEQIRIIERAANQRAQVLVVECMAVQPELQHTAQHDILRADIGVITNVRRDHSDVMGETLHQICAALSNTIPKRGILFTAEVQQAADLEKKSKLLDSRFVQVQPDGSEPGFDFAENIALALAVCEYLGINRKTALEGMERFHRDPYALSLHCLGQALFINGLSINDVQSTCAVWERLKAEYSLADKELILLVNNRPDRGSRTEDMLRVCLERKLPGASVIDLASPTAIELQKLTAAQVIFAVGNIANGGRELMTWVRQEGRAFVQ